VVFLFMSIRGFNDDNRPQPPENKKEKKKITVRLTDSYEREVWPGPENGEKGPRRVFGLMDTVFGSFTGLMPNTKYNLFIANNEGKTISEAYPLRLMSNENGVIPTTALWWDIGYRYDDTRRTRYPARNFNKYSYNLIIAEEGKRQRPVSEIRIPISGSVERPYIFTCDKEGNPKNTFVLHKDDVYLKGENLAFKNTDRMYIYVVKDRWKWRPGDKLDREGFLVQRYVETLDPDEKAGKNLRHLIWESDDLEPGSYDVIVTGRGLGILFENDLIDSNYGVGFKVIKDVEEKGPVEKKDIIMDLACQVPARIVKFGVLDNPHSPAYKDYFSPQEEVWTAVELPEPGDTHRQTGKARIYVIEHREGEKLTSGTKLIDVSGGYEEVLLQPGCGHGIYTCVWKKPAKPEQDYDRYDVVLDFCNADGEFGTYDTGLDILDTGKAGEGGFYVPKDWVCLESVSFNHTPDALCCDAVTLSYGKGASLRVPEWIRGRRSFPAAYVKNRRFTVQPAFSFSENVEYADFKVYCKSGNFTDLKSREIYLDKELSYFFQSVNNTPDKIRSFYLEWEWYLRGIQTKNGAILRFKEEKRIATTINKIYIVLDNPQCPWTISGKTAPWTDVLDLACQVAHGETTPEGAASKITQFLYVENGGCYDKENHYTTGPNQAFQLSRFLERMPNVGDANCNDMGRAVVTFANVLGCDMDLRYCFLFGKELNCILPMGKDWTCTESFDEHTFAAIGDNIFDATLKADSWGSLTDEPCRPVWMINIPWSLYERMVVKDPSADLLMKMGNLVLESVGDKNVIMKDKDSVLENALKNAEYYRSKSLKVSYPTIEKFQIADKCEEK